MRKQIRRIRQASSNALLLLLAIAAMPSSAQDMKPLSSLLAKSISASGRKRVAVVDFTDLQGNVTELGRFLAEDLSIDLVGDAKGFEVIERTQLKVILQEHRLSATGLIDPQTARKLGQIAGVDALVTGTITAFGDTVRLSAKVLDTQTAKMLGAATSDIPKTKAIEELLNRGIGASSSTKPASVEAQATSSQSVRPVTFSAKGQLGNRIDLTFTPGRCRLERQDFVCKVTLMNSGNRTLQFYFTKEQCSLVDDSGNQYKLESISIGQKEQENLQPEVPINIVAVARDVSDRATRMTLLLGFVANWPESYTAAVRNIPVERRQDGPP